MDAAIALYSNTHETFEATPVSGNGYRTLINPAYILLTAGNVSHFSFCKSKSQSKSDSVTKLVHLSFFYILSQFAGSALPFLFS